MKLCNYLSIVFISFTCILVFAACGSGSSTDNSIVNNGPTLAEATADLDKPDLILPAASTPETQANENGTTTQSSGSGLTVTSEPLPVTASSSSLTLRRFLWKPISERDGNVVVLIDRENVRVEVMGSISETLTDFGPSNDRGTTARGNFPGCQYGTDVLLEFYDASSGLRLGYTNGATSVRVTDGCSRLELDL